MRQFKAKSEPRIAPLVIGNLSSLKSLVDSVDPTQPLLSIASSHLARFKLWSATLSAHRSSGNRALEYRLRDASSVRGQVLSLLQDLSTAVDKARAHTEDQPQTMCEPAYDEIEEYFRDGDTQSQTPMDRSLAQIGYVIDCLLRLSTTISNPAPHDHFVSRAGISDFYAPWDVRHVQDKFANIDPVMAKRLGKAITMRRHYFNYRQEHHAKLAEGIEDENDTKGERTTVASSIPEKFKDAQSSDYSHLDNQSEFSATSYALSSAESDQLTVPRIPKDHLVGPFLCPFCQIIIEVDTRRDWKRHVFRDLRPYICLDKSCGMPNQQYSHRSHWTSHMMQEHWTMWYCSFGCSEMFSTRNAWHEHISIAHGQVVPVEDLNILEESSLQKALHKAAGSCPICSDVHIKDFKNYSSHVGHHLEQLALFSLPKIETDHGEDGDESGDADDIDLTTESDDKGYGDQDDDEENSETGNEDHGEATDEDLAIGEVNADDDILRVSSIHEDGDDTSEGSFETDTASSDEGDRNAETIKMISGFGRVKFDHDEELDLSSSDSETSSKSNGDSKPKLPESVPRVHPHYGTYPTSSKALSSPMTEALFDPTPENDQRIKQLKTEEEQEWDRGADARQKEIEKEIQGGTLRAVGVGMKELEIENQRLRNELERYKKFGGPRQAAENARKDLLGEGRSIKTKERVKEEATATEIDEQESHDQVEADPKAEDEYREGELEVAVTAETAAEARLEAEMKADESIEAEEEAEKAAKTKMAEEAEWRKLLEEEAKLTAEVEVRAKIEAERKLAEDVAIANETALKENEAWKKAALEELKQKAAKEEQLSKGLE